MGRGAVSDTSVPRPSVKISLEGATPEFSTGNLDSVFTSVTALILLAMVRVALPASRFKMRCEV